MTSHAIQLRGVGKDYAHFRLEDLDLDLDRGHIMGFIGPNGAGKTTTIRILMGLVQQDRGEVHVLGHAMPRQQIAAKRDIGFVSEDMRLYQSGTLSWHMRFTASIYPGWDQIYADELVRRFDLQTEQKLAGFSHGQRVKAMLLLVLARRPRLLILDEPTTGLDPVARHEVLAAMMEALLDEERTILFSSHNTADVEQISDQITFIDRGKVIASKDKESFLDDWRRLQLEIPPDTRLPRVAGVVDCHRNGRLATITTHRFAEGLLAAYTQIGATIHKVESLSLEEIFLKTVQHNRGGNPA